MPASSSETRNRWRKRKREPQVSRRQKHQDDDDDEEEDEDDLEQQPEYDDDPNPHSAPNNSSDPAPIAGESEVLSAGGVRISDFPPVIKHTVNRPHSSVLGIVALERAIRCGESRNQQNNAVVLENISYGQLQALSAVPAGSPALAVGDQERGDGSSAYVITPPPIMEGRGVVKRFGNDRVHLVPMHADWFSPNTVHRLERQVVPHFFSGKSADHVPEKYMECRNRIVAKYMENPEKRLSVADFQGLVVGVDVDDLTRIVRFLDHWGIINYCAAAPNREPRNDGSYLRDDSNGEVHVPSAALKSIDSLIQFDKPKCRLKAADVYPSLSCQGDEDSDLDSRIRERLSENRCNYCSHALPIVYYQSQKEVDILLCLDCFHEGRFVTGHSSLDFIRVDSSKDYGDLDGESWTDQETLLLLEAMEIYNENWNEIAEHVGTKSKAQCILHFIRLPMEDGPLENIEVPSMPISSNLSNREDPAGLHSSSNGDLAGSFQDPDSESRLPFANSGNPVMALVAFLASAVGPRVAAACAHASLAALSEDNGLAASGNIRQMEGSGHGNRMNSEGMHSREGSSHGETTNSSQQKDESSAVQGPCNQNDGEVAPLSAEKVRAAVKAGLSAAATKAKLFADHEEREIQRLSANIINHQLKRLELKLRQFAEVETLLMKECEQVERARQRIAAERTRMMSTQFGAAGVASSISLPGVGPAMVNSTGTNRQQVISGSPSQPFISGYGNNQPIHPHMSFMPRQPMYGLGPRLPLSTINPSSSATPNVMFNAAASAQSAVSNPMLRPVSGTSSGLG
uniref:Putative SWI/SNF complex subunit SWI3C isoform X1 n=1 Tax=Davidia involucrata TaxID=16924 RepID=A0A5B7A1I3_DAVIN